MALRYVTDPAAIADEPGVRRAFVPAGLGKAELLSLLADQLGFPAYFGHNWDALDECLRDLGWIAEPVVRIVHADVPPLPVYLAILRDAERQHAAGDRQLDLVFPSSAGPGNG